MAALFPGQIRFPDLCFLKPIPRLQLAPVHRRLFRLSIGSPGAPPTAGLIGGKATTTAIFSQPGTYELRAYADDGVLTTPVDVVVTVQESEQH